MDKAIDTIVTSQGTVLINIVLIIVGAALINIFIRTLLQRLANSATKREMFKTSQERQKRLKTYNSIITAVTVSTVWFVAILMIMQTLGIPIAPLLTSAGIIGAALAFGTQSIVRDFISGLFIIAEDRYKVDDYVEIHGGGGLMRGRVEAVNIRTTSIRTSDGSLVHVPNGTITSTSNKSIPSLKAFLEIDIDSTMTIDELGSFLTRLSEELDSEDATTHLFKGPVSISSIDKIGKGKFTVSLEYLTSAKHLDDAKSALLRHLADAASRKLVKLA